MNVAQQNTGKDVIQFLMQHPLRAQSRLDEVLAPLTESGEIQVSTHTLRAGQDVLRLAAGGDTVVYVLEGRAVVGRLATASPARLAAPGGELLSCGEPLQLQQAATHLLAAHPQQACSVLVLQAGEPVGEELLAPSEPLAQDMLNSAAQVDNYYCGYDERYQEVYKNDADLWESDQPNQSLQALLQTRPDLLTGKLVDLGCGEGRDTLYLAARGADVLGVDISRAALDKGRARAAQAGLHNVRFVEADVIYLRNLEDGSFDTALNMGCLHMLTEVEHRAGHIRRVFDILKPGGYFLVDHCQRNWGKGFFSIPDYAAIADNLVPGREIPRRIRTSDGLKFIPLKVLPYREMLKDSLIQEICQQGFEVVDSALTSTEAFGDSALVLFRKPSGT